MVKQPLGSDLKSRHTVFLLQDEYMWEMVFIVMVFYVCCALSQNIGKLHIQTLKQKIYMKHTLIFIWAYLFNKPFDQGSPSVTVPEMWLICRLRNHYKSCDTAKITFYYNFIL